MHMQGHFRIAFNEGFNRRGQGISGLCVCRGDQEAAFALVGCAGRAPIHSTAELTVIEGRSEMPIPSRGDLVAEDRLALVGPLDMLGAAATSVSANSSVGVLDRGAAARQKKRTKKQESATDLAESFSR